MIVVTVTEAKANLSKLLAAVERGEEIEIHRRGRPVATLTVLRPEPAVRELGLGEGKGWMALDWKEWPDEEARALGIIN